MFSDKEELLDACMAEALRPDHAVEQIASISMDQPLADRLAEAAEALSAHLERIGAVAGALMASGHRRRGSSTGPGGRRGASADLVKATADLFEPKAASLRAPAEQVALVFLDLQFSKARPGEGLSTSDLVQIFLHGALRGEPS